jgi:hypothetical protein
MRLPTSWVWGHAVVGLFAMLCVVESVSRLTGGLIQTLMPASDPISLKRSDVWLAGILLGLAWGGMSAAIMRWRSNARLRYGTTLETSLRHLGG